MTTVFAAVPAHLHETARRSTRPEVRIALLGLGNVGGAVAELASQPIVSGARLSISAALVRDLQRRRAVDTSRIPLTVDPEAALASDPDVVVEVLGGLEPARSIVVKALSRGIPVVTANKTLLATHGDELLETSARTGTPLLYEASVLAGVPFLGTFARRRFAREVTAVAGIVNGTSNFILSRMSAERVAFSAALADAQRAGYAEPDPAKDIDGDDAVEKLCVLLRHFGGWSVAAGQIEKSGIADIELQDLQHAVSFDGFIRPVIAASWNGDRLAAYAGPAFVNASSPLARVSGVQNAVSVTTRWTGDLFFSGPGAGPTVTAATILDDVAEAQHLAAPGIAATRVAPACAAIDSGWFVRLTGSDITSRPDGGSLLASLGVRLRRISAISSREGRQRQWLLTHPCAREHLAAALDVVAARCECTPWSIRAID